MVAGVGLCRGRTKERPDLTAIESLGAWKVRRFEVLRNERVLAVQEDRNLPPAQCGPHPRIPHLGAG